MPAADWCLARFPSVSRDAGNELSPELPHDVLRIIWQTMWRAQAASQLQRAWRARRLRLRRIGWLFYVLKYVSKDVCYWNVEYQSRGAVHLHAMWLAEVD